MPRTPAENRKAALKRFSLRRAEVIRKFKRNQIPVISFSSLENMTVAQLTDLMENVKDIRALTKQRIKLKVPLQEAPSADTEVEAVDAEAEAGVAEVEAGDTEAETKHTEVPEIVDAEYEVPQDEKDRLAAKSVDSLISIVQDHEAQFKKDYNPSTAWANREKRKKKPAYIEEAEDKHMKLSKWMDVIVMAKYNELNDNAEFDGLKRQWIGANDERSTYLEDVLSFEKPEKEVKPKARARTKGTRAKKSEPAEVDEQDAMMENMKFDHIYAFLKGIETQFMNRYDGKLSQLQFAKANEEIDDILTRIDQVRVKFDGDFKDNEAHQKLKARLYGFGSMLRDSIG